MYVYLDEYIQKTSLNVRDTAKYILIQLHRYIKNYYSEVSGLNCMYLHEDVFFTSKIWRFGNIDSLEELQ